MRNTSRQTSKTHPSNPVQPDINPRLHASTRTIAPKHAQILEKTSPSDHGADKRPRIGEMGAGDAAGRPKRCPNVQMFRGRSVGGADPGVEDEKEEPAGREDLEDFEGSRHRHAYG